MSGHEPESLSPYDQQVYHLEKQLDIECKVKQGADQVTTVTFRKLDKSGFEMAKMCPVGEWSGKQKVCKILTTQWSGLWLTCVFLVQFYTAIYYKLDQFVSGF